MEGLESEVRSKGSGCVGKTAALKLTALIYVSLYNFTYGVRGLSSAL